MGWTYVAFFQMPTSTEGRAVPIASGGHELSSKLNKLLRINQTVAATLDIGQVLKLSLELEREVVDAETGSILLLDSSGEYLEFAVALGGAEHILKNHRIRIGEGVAGAVALSRRPLYIPDVRKDERFNAYFDSKTGFQTRSILCVPIQTADRLIGVAQAINRTDGTPFTEEDLALFSAFAGTLAVAIENARLHKELLDEEKMQQEISAARQVQESYLPRSFPAVPGFEFSGQLVPARYVSGDFYDAFKTPDGRVTILIGDVSGKGLPSALYMCRLLTELRVGLKYGVSIDDVLVSVNTVLCDQSTRGMFVTLIVFQLDPASRRLTVANAGHLPFFMKTNGDWREMIGPKNPPLGIVPRRQITSQELVCPEEFQILAVTDGVTEARNERGELYGQEQLKQSIDRTNLTPALLNSYLQLNLQRFAGSAEPSDDTTIVAFGSVRPVDRISFTIRSHPAYLSLIRDAAGRMLDQATDSKLISEIQVALSEAVSNVIRHTYQNDQTRPISVDLTLSGAGLEAVIRDFGPKVNPDQLVGRALDQVRPGGLGIHFIRTVFDEFAFDSSVSDGNRLVLRRAFTRGPRRAEETDRGGAGV